MAVSPADRVSGAPVPAVRTAAFRGQTVGAMVFVMLLQLFVYLAAVVNPALLPGNVTPLVPYLTYYFFSMFLALYLIGRNAETVGGSLEAFLTQFSIGAAAAWLILTLVTYSGGVAAPLSGSDKLLELIYIGLFIAPVEELLFRVAAPKVVGWVIGSVVLFALYHVPVEILEYGASGWEPVVANLASIAIMGVLLWLAYSLKRPVLTLGGQRFPLGGLGLSMGIHFLYDAFVAGAVIGLPLGLAGLGLTPL